MNESNNQVNNESDELRSSESKSLEVPKESKRELTPKNRLFLQALSDGKSTLQAYQEAGYKGNQHAAYQLRSDLKEELIQVLESKGIDRVGLMSELQKVLALPLRDTEITLKGKLSALNLLFKMVQAQTPSEQSTPKITAFIVNAQPTKTQPSQAIDTSTAD